MGGHHPESVWHLSGKAVLAAWADRQFGVVDVAVERCTPDRARRSDVRVRFNNGCQVALEVQATPLTDREWSARHADYQRQGITDVWLWRPGTRPHWVVVDHGQSLWELDPGKERAYLLLGVAHDRPPCWWTGEDLHLYAQHEPPCVGDTPGWPASAVTSSADRLSFHQQGQHGTRRAARPASGRCAPIRWDDGAR